MAGNLALGQRRLLGSPKTYNYIQYNWYATLISINPYEVLMELVEQGVGKVPILSMVVDGSDATQQKWQNPNFYCDDIQAQFEQAWRKAVGLSSTTPPPPPPKFNWIDIVDANIASMGIDYGSDQSLIFSRGGGI